jgi:hypothetical protein
MTAFRGIAENGALIARREELGNGAGVRPIRPRRFAFKLAVNNYFWTRFVLMAESRTGALKRLVAP